ncbi:MAG: hypothetical protein Q8L48_00695 [Archangium sp.]|nr:hypothetical protein [Archangium sp.]
MRSPRDEDVLAEALRDAHERISLLEAQLAPRQAGETSARALLGKLIKRRQRVQQRGVQVWEGAQRAALRMFVLAVGCVALSTGAMALDATLGGVSIVVTLGVLALEGGR